MKIFNKAGERFSGFFGVADDELYDDNEPFVDEEVIDEQPVIETTPEQTEMNNVSRHIEKDEEIQEPVENDSHSTENIKISEPENQYINEKVVEMNTYQPTSNGNKRMVVARQHNRKVTVYEPRDYMDCKQIAQALFKKEIVILSFRLMAEKSARRVVDFMTGVVYSIDGDIQRLGDDIFICTPANVDVDSSFTRNIIATHIPK
ncbi:cell division protein SepF [Vagococcus bubulae]|uniref:Cell division protein SepF n=1 Tax=Vagococcus bubulae TaxID=1977868 RepID=A0A429ZMD6_9ENTE|nr:cell division protein SepF [Vagococcus bubulae]RST94843.1 hypothetical protein CBF36_04765 [Vagococcus bubulae]